jgi:hypothetical protein
MTKRGLPPELRLYAHGQGYDIVQRPLMRDDETMILAKEMFFAMHPSVVTSSTFTFVCDNFFINADGPSPMLHKTLRQIFEVA